MSMDYLENEAFRRLCNEPDVRIDDNHYRVDTHQLMIKRRLEGTSGWKRHQRFDTHEAMERAWADIKGIDGAVAEDYLSSNKTNETNKGIHADSLHSMTGLYAPSAGGNTPGRDTGHPLSKGGLGGTPFQKGAVAAQGQLFTRHDGAHTAQAVSEQYRRAVSGLLEGIRFGAMLLDLQDSLIICRDKFSSFFAHGGDRRGGTGVKEWLSEHCPEVDYGWAMKFKRLAEGVLEHCKVPAEVPLALALPQPYGLELYAPSAGGNTPGRDTGLPLSEGGLGGAPFGKGAAEDAEVAGDKRLAKVRREVALFLEGKSARQLEFEFGHREPKPRGGDRRSGIRLTEIEKHEYAVERARRDWTRALADIKALVEMQTHLLLDEDMLARGVEVLAIARDGLRAAQGKRK